MEDIKEMFKGKNFDDTTLKFLNNFINEFDDLFGKYVPKEELIRRIQENLNENIEFCDLGNPNTLGSYDREIKKISVKEGLTEDEKKSVFFHEMVHCITNQKDFTGFSRLLVLDELLQLEDDVEISKVTAVGLTEGFTQFVSKIRDQKYGTPINSYPILTEQTQNLAELIGIDKFLDTGFNRPTEFEKLMMDEGIVEDEFEVNDFLEKFDIIHKNEKQILLERGLSEEIGYNNLLNGIFGTRDSKKRQINGAKASIVTTLLGKVSKLPVATKEDIKTIYDLIQKYSGQLSLRNSRDSYKVFFDKIEELEIGGRTREEILALVPEESKMMLETDFRFRDFMKLSKPEMLERMTKEDIYEDILADGFEDDYSIELARKIFEGVNDKDLAYALSLHLVDGFSQILVDKGWDTDLLSIEVIDLDYQSGLTFNLYEANGESIKYLSTFTDVNDLCQIEEMRVCTAAEKLKLLDENSELDANSILMTSSSGAVLAYNGNSDYTFIGDDKKVSQNYGDVQIFMSKAETVQRLLRSSAERFKYMASINSPSVILRDNGKRVMKLEKEHKAFIGGKKFTPADVENATSEVSLEDIERILSEIVEPEHTREEVFEKGIGYNE